MNLFNQCRWFIIQERWNLKFRICILVNHCQYLWELIQSSIKDLFIDLAQMNFLIVIPKQILQFANQIKFQGMKINIPKKIRFSKTLIKMIILIRTCTHLMELRFKQKIYYNQFIVHYKIKIRQHLISTLTCLILQNSKQNLHPQSRYQKQDKINKIPHHRFKINYMITKSIIASITLYKQKFFKKWLKCRIFLTKMIILDPNCPNLKYYQKFKANKKKYQIEISIYKDYHIINNKYQQNICLNKIIF
ncbi:hypothetical protein ABPG72_008929 [Tetrahymena utriculariae]